MSEGINRVTILGNLCADPELRYTQSNQGVLSIRLACNESWYDTNSKERKERVEYINVVIWGKRGEALNKILSKGSPVLVEGRLQTRSYEAKDGSGKRYSTEVVATNVVLTGGRRDSAGQRDSGEDHAANGSGESHDQPYDESSIPF
jgi:single-strand DNA-binding protein